MDMVILTESHWSSDMEWQDSAWMCLHFGPNTKSHAGTSVMISKRLCQSLDISSVHIHPGRLAHVRNPAETHPIDVIAVYQYAGTSNSTLLQYRQEIWDKLDTYLHRLPNRNMLVCSGDFNSHLPAVPLLAPVSTFRPHRSTLVQRPTRTVKSC